VDEDYFQWKWSHPSAAAVGHLDRIIDRAKFFKKRREPFLFVLNELNFTRYANEVKFKFF
jgi:hypothetical protein